ncbi:MAG: alpha/beta fold hydrolase [Bacteroidetes bacterium]|nr:MAG: alpha/beta fold hydrolase [Bacteroidota bacterium]
MPYLQRSSYRPPFLFRQAHVNTIYPALFRRVAPLPYERITIDTPDADFLDLDFVRRGHARIVVGLHGLEGSSKRPYIQGMLWQFLKRNWDVVGMNFRSCSGRMNRQLVSYNMGTSGDLKLVVEALIEMGYREIVLIGFSLGGNVTLKYLGEVGKLLPAAVRGAIAVSVPCHIASANKEIAKLENRLYLRRFLRTLHQKMAIKAQQFPGQIQIPERAFTTFHEFDDHFTGPLHGYRNGQDYYERCSSLQFLPYIARPALLLNAQDDTFLSPLCYPRELAARSSYLYLETPTYGGHVGFYQKVAKGGYYSERRAVAFVDEVLGCS